jgi:hypothetical protein
MDNPAQFQNNNRISVCRHMTKGKYPENFKKQIIKKDYLPQQIFNPKDAGLVWKKMPPCTFMNDKASLGFKVSNDCITLLISFTALGDSMTYQNPSNTCEQKFFMQSLIYTISYFICLWFLYTHLSCKASTSASKFHSLQQARSTFTWCKQLLQNLACTQATGKSIHRMKNE